MLKCICIGVIFVAHTIADPGEVCEGNTCEHALRVELLQTQVLSTKFAVDVGDESDDIDGGNSNSPHNLHAKEDLCDAAVAMNIAKRHNGFIAQPSANNLGGKGPEKGEQSIRFRDVFPEKDVDLKVVVAEGEYTPKNSAVNGIVNGVYGNINIQSGTKVVLNFTFVDSNTGAPVKTPRFTMTFYDFDANKLGSASESVTFSGFSTYYTTTNTELDLTPNTDDSLTVAATHYGNKSDNPISPFALTDVMKNRAISLTFEPLYEFTVVFASTPSLKMTPGGRNLLFGGPSSLQCHDQSLIQNTTCDEFSCPSGMARVPFAEFINGDDAGTCCAKQALCTTHTCSSGKVLIAKALETYCTGIECDDDTCCEDENELCSRPALRLLKKKVNNLGGQGPDKGTDHTLTFGNVFLGNNPKVDLVISVVDGYEPYDSARNGRKGKFGVLNVKSGTKAGLSFKFVDAETGANVTVPGFLFSIYDIDSGKADGTTFEYVEVNGYNGYKTSETTEVLAEPTTATSGSFYGTTVGNGFDNPKDLYNLTESQKNRLVSFKFPPTSEFNLNFGATGGLEGRNLYFAGESALYCTPQA